MKIILTGGGTAGHVMVNLLLIPMLRDRGHETVYIGSKRGIEKKLITDQGIATYHGIATGKLRRYFSWENFLDFFRLWIGIAQALVLLKKEKPQVIFSAGSFVTVPVMIAGWMCRIPSLIRETDCTMGLANRICAKFAKKVFATFPGTLSEYHAEYCGLIVRPSLLGPPMERSPLFTDTKPVLLVSGGSLGAERINRIIWQGLDELTQHFNIVHACGKGKCNPQLSSGEHYLQYEYIEDMSYYYAISDLVIMRSGSNSVCEGLALGKRMLCIPLSRNSRREQVENARFAEDHGCAVLLDEDELSVPFLLEKLRELRNKPVDHTCKLTKEQLQQNCLQLLGEIEKSS